MRGLVQLIEALGLSADLVFRGQPENGMKSMYQRVMAAGLPMKVQSSEEKVQVNGYHAAP